VFFWQEKRCLSKASYFFQKKNTPHLPARPQTQQMGNKTTNQRPLTQSQISPML
jgi:hypothetical protein